MTTPRDYSPAVCVVNETKLIACGGMDSDSQALKSCEMLDLTNKTAGWTLITDMDLERIYTSGTLLPDNNTFVMIGGYDGNGASSASCEKLDIKAGTWSSAGNLSLGPRNGHRSILYLDNVIVLGGVGNDGVPVNTCEQYDATSNTWSEFQPSFINARYDFAAAVVLDDIYIAGGVAEDTSKSTVVEVFNGTLWSELSSLIAQARYSCVAVSFRNKFLLVGGNPTTIEVFDPVSSTWNTTFPPMIIAPSRERLAAASF